MHVQSVIEKFPHDAVVSLESASDLDETTLSSSVSTSKGSSSPTQNEPHKTRRRLTGIIEDVGETSLALPAAAKIDSQNQPTDKELDQVKWPSETTIDEENRGELPKGNLETQSLKRHDTVGSSTRRDRAPTGASIAPAEAPGVLVEHLSLVAPVASSDSFAYLYKPKVKLAPRPSLEKRHSGSFGRPVSALPAGIRLGQRDIDTMPRPQTQQNPGRSFFGIPNVRPYGSSVASAYNSPTFDRPISRAGSAVTVPANARYVEHSASATPEKQRLMKALQKRKKTQSAKAASKEADKPLKASQNDHQLSKTIANDNDEHVLSPTTSFTESEAINDRSTSPNLSQNGLIKQTKEAISSNTISDPAQDVIPELDKKPAHPMNNVNVLNEKHIDKETNNLQEAINEPASTPNADSGIMIEESGRNMSMAPACSTSANMLVPPLLGPDLNSRQIQPEGIPLPTAEHEESDLLYQHETSKDIQANTKAALMTLSEHNLKSVEIANDSTNHLAASIKRASESTLGRKQKPQPLTPTRPEDVSRAPSLSEESLLDELQSATVEEAKSVSLSKSPLTPFSPASPRQIEMRRSSETSAKPAQPEAEAPRTPAVDQSLLGISRLHSDLQVSNTHVSSLPTRSSSMPMKPGTGRDSPSVLTALPMRADSSSPVPSHSPDMERPTSKKSAVSSLISQRIKAFENFSSSGTQSTSAKAIVTPAIVSLRKTSLNTPQASAGAESGRGGNFFQTQTGYPTPSPSPQGFSARLIKTNKPSASNAKQKGGPISINTTFKKDPSTSSLERGTVLDEAPRSPPARVNKRPSFFGPKSPKKKSASISTTNSSREGMTLPRADASSSRISVTSSRSGSDAPAGPPRSQSSDSITSDSEKRGSKKKRLFKRLSNIAGAPRRTIAQTLNPTLNSQSIPENQEPEPSKRWSTNVAVGDVNVQFPDTLVCVTFLGMHRIS